MAFYERDDLIDAAVAVTRELANVPDEVLQRLARTLRSEFGGGRYYIARRPRRKPATGRGAASDVST
ncbi:MAG: hypothetical protein KJ018_11535 [Burkholderiales bacterium]|nr:hypothetical protein [Burkholderiales bacterium]